MSLPLLVVLGLIGWVAATLLGIRPWLVGAVAVLVLVLINV